MVLTKHQLVAYWANKYNYTLDAVNTMINEFGQVVIDQVSMGNTISIPGVAKFGVKVSQPRKGFNPQTGETCIFPSKPHAFCKPGAALRRAAQNAPLEG